MGKPISHAAGEVKATRARVQFFLDNIHSVLQHEVVNQKDTVRPLFLLFCVTAFISIVWYACVCVCVCVC
jgi:hypothetical protein